MPADRPTALRLRWIIWHPQEKLWTWTAVRAVHKVLGDSVVAKGVLGAIVTADSFLLVGRVLARRARFAAAHRMDTVAGALARPKVLYLDCGVHKEGLQIRWMHEWFSTRYDLEILGFEAGSGHIATPGRSWPMWRACSSTMWPWSGPITSATRSSST